MDNLSVIERGNMKLIICEKPSLATNVAKAIGINKRLDGYIECKDNYIVTYAYGHLLMLKDIKDYKGYENFVWKSLKSPFIPDPFEYKIKDDSGVKKQLKIIKKLITDNKNNLESVDRKSTRLNSSH